MGFFSDNGLVSGSPEDTELDASVFSGGVSYDIPYGMTRKSPMEDRFRDYVKYGTIDGIPVDDKCKNRAIPKETDLLEIFVPSHDVHAECFSISPGSEDIAKYQSILQESASGNAVVQVHERTFSKDGYMVLIVYDRIRMVFRKPDDDKTYPVIGDTDKK